MVLISAVFMRFQGKWWASLPSTSQRNTLYENLRKERTSQHDLVDVVLDMSGVG